MTHGNHQAEASGAVGLAHLLASRRAHAHEIADHVARGPSSARSPASKRTAGALALASAAAAAKRSRPNPVLSVPAPPTVSASPPSPVAMREPVRMMARRTASTVRASPSLRWRCQHFLVSSLLGASLAPAAAAIDPWADVDLCRARPMGCTDSGVAYCREAEEAIYRETDGRPTAYEAAVRRIAYALRSGGRALMTRYGAHVLATLDDDALAASTAPGRRRLRAHRRMGVCRAMMADADIFGDALAAVVRCRECGGDDIVSNQLQTRGADEPMTVFNRCANCNARWRQ
ncbi:TFIIS C-domain containing protein [Pandoravirus quercus]|uniref:TFIIS C-domain containing protein n=1 Tax=Pandoravirus quercus TaxID=2107709 RepID=A0A2U7U927_9VIRU|nr:TFIIS C-domain containing protein [Pandoravirus quercus]AVK74890.1 TFIIS C-domain containing protein [Pandoravirus quercus]